MAHLYVATNGLSVWRGAAPTVAKRLISCQRALAFIVAARCGR